MADTRQDESRLSARRADRRIAGVMQARINRGLPSFSFPSPSSPQASGDGIEETVRAAPFARADRIRAPTRAPRRTSRVDSPHVPRDTVQSA